CGQQEKIRDVKFCCCVWIAPVTAVRGPIAYFNSASTSARVGIPAWAPRLVTARDAAAQANRAAASTPIPSTTQVANAPIKVSPAPTVSTASTWGAGRCPVNDDEAIHAP